MPTRDLVVARLEALTRADQNGVAPDTRPDTARPPATRMATSPSVASAARPRRSRVYAVAQGLIGVVVTAGLIGGAYELGREPAVSQRVDPAMALVWNGARTMLGDAPDVAPPVASPPVKAKGRRHVRRARSRASAPAAGAAAATSGGANTDLIAATSGVAALPPGRVSLSLPFPVTVAAEDRELDVRPGDAFVVDGGRHRLTVRNPALQFETVVDVDVRSDAVTTVEIPVPDGTLQVNALPWAEVWVDGRSAGETPLGNLRVPIGTHEIRFHHPELGDQVRTADVTTTSAVRVTVDLRP